VPVHSLGREPSVPFFCASESVPYLCLFKISIGNNSSRCACHYQNLIPLPSHCLFHYIYTISGLLHKISPTIIMSSSKTILASITKLNGQNWHTWSKETKAYLTMEEFWELIDPTEAAPTSVANLKHDKKAYAHIWFLVEPNCWDAIIELKSGHKAQAALKAKHEKDTLSTCMNLCQHFYTLSHNHAVGVMQFVNNVLTVVCQLKSINGKPTKLMANPQRTKSRINF